MPTLQHILEPAIRFGLLDAATADRIRREVHAHRGDPVRVTSMLARVPTSALFRAMAADRGVDFLGRAELAGRRDLVSRLPAALVRRKMVLPVGDTADHVLCAVGDVESLDDTRLNEAVRHAFDLPVKLALADPEELRPAIEQALQTSHAAVAAASADDAVGIVAELMREAYVRRASDIHIEPSAHGYRVRFRIDGELEIYRDDMPVSLAQAALSRLKVLAEMDIAETRQPQDGSLVHRMADADGRSFDIRLATAPTKHGERATLRLLGAESREFTLADLGLNEAMGRRFDELIGRPSGLVLLAGPTGSGKSTTLYAALRQITRPSLNVMTVEDPVEYSITGASQLEIDGFGKVTFSSALRSLLRHDPDVLMVGEIRDKETADIALRAAATGHLVFSTLHTNTAVGAVTRLVDMGCEPYMVAATLLAVISQRLVRRLCPACKVVRPVTDAERKFLDAGASAHAFDAKGCVRCQRAGFLGRTGVFEMFELDDAVRESITRGDDEGGIARSASRLTTLRQDAADKVLAGVTTFDEVHRIVVLES